MLYPAIATLTAAALAGLITFGVMFRGPNGYIRLKKDLLFTWVTLDEYVREMKYPFKAYRVVTDDGYILTVHRIPHGRKAAHPLECDGPGNTPGKAADGNVPKEVESETSEETEEESEYHEHPAVFGLFRFPAIRWKFKKTDYSKIKSKVKKCKRLPILVVHGVFGCAGTMMVHNSSALAYVLADGGYDTWLYNSRGTMYSRTHTKLDADKDTEYWEFSYHEMGYYDLQATVDVVLKVTGCPKVIMIGYSMGNAVGVAFLAERPEYHDKVAQFFALAPAIYLDHMESTSVEMIADIIISIQGVARLFKIREVFPMTPLTRWSTTVVCGTPGLRNSCKSVIKWTGGDSGESIDATKLVEYMRYVPAGVSLRTLHHLAQQLKNPKCFAKFNFGSKKNKAVYGSEAAPCYNLGGITTPFCVYYGLHDTQVTVTDANRFVHEVPNVSCDIAVPFNHFDFMWSKYGKALIYDDIVKKSNKISCENKGPTEPKLIS